MERLTRRADFLAAATGVRASAAGFVLQARARGDTGPIRVGFTVSRKVGNAVVRNRVRRRLREVVRLARRTDTSAQMQRGTDYVLIGRRAALEAAFDRLAADLAGALDQVHKRQRAAKPADSRPARSRPARSASASPRVRTSDDRNGL